MLFSQSPTTITLSPVPSVFARLGRTIKTRVPVFKSCLPSLLTMKGRKSFSKRKWPFVSAGAGAKRKYFLPSLRLPSSSSSYRSFRESTSSPTTVDSETSNSSTSDIILVPSSPVCVPVLPVTPPVGTKITDRFWPEEDSEHSETKVSLSGGLASGMVNVLSPPPYHRRSPSTDVQQEDLLSCDTHPGPLHHKDWQDESLPLLFPF